MMHKDNIQEKKLTKSNGSKGNLKELFQGRILQWEKTLNGLTIGDHPEEIECICGKIIATKKLLSNSGF